MFRRIVGTAARLAQAVIRLTVWPWRQQIHITRFAMYEELRSVVGPLVYESASTDRPPVALAIGDSASLINQLGLQPIEVVEANYPVHDMRKLRHFDDETFELVVSDQVLEHVDGDPSQALAESFRVAKPGGLVIHTTCFMNPLHYGPKDLWRFSPDGLERAVSGHGSVILVGGWGNPIALAMIALGLRHTPTPPAWHPIGRVARHNRPSWPIITWVVARRN